jgi:hypothetical protein
MLSAEINLVPRSQTVRANNSPKKIEALTEHRRQAAAEPGDINGMTPEPLPQPVETELAHLESHTTTIRVED